MHQMASGIRNEKILSTSDRLAGGSARIASHAGARGFVEFESAFEFNGETFTNGSIQKKSIQNKPDGSCKSALPSGLCVPMMPEQS